jgi:PST family polysaccharide transporter
MADNLNKKIVNATKWSTITEVMGKLVAPISSMVLARLLTPEAFGVVATLNMVIAFAEIFTDAGFQKYLIQQPFKDADDRDKDTNVAFWSNLTMSFVLWALIAVFNAPLADLVGSPGLGHVLVVACASIPIAAFSSIQMALFKRSLDFKTLFWRRLAVIMVPICVTIPLALWLRSYWALVIGTIVTNLVNAILLTVKSNWRPCRYYSFARLKEMFSFCSWSIGDSVLVWATAYIDIFFIGRALDAYYLGLYKTSIHTVAQFTSLITASILPVIMPTISRLQDNLPEMRRVLLNFQKYTSVLLLPLGVGIFMFSDLVTEVMLGSQWTEAAPFIGLWGLMDVTTVIFARFCSQVYPAIGKPRISVIVQILHLVVLIPAVIISGQYGFRPLYITRSLVRLELVMVNLIFVYIMIKQSPWKMLANVLPEILSCVVMAIVAFLLLQINDTIVFSIMWIFMCVVVYFVTLYLFPKDRVILLGLKDKALSSINAITKRKKKK